MAEVVGSSPTGSIGEACGSRATFSVTVPPLSSAPTEQTRTSWWTLVAVCGATFMLLVDVTIVQVALPRIHNELHASFT